MYKKYIVIASLTPWNVVINKLESLCNSEEEAYLLRNILYFVSRNGNCFLEDVFADDKWDEEKISQFPDRYQDTKESCRKQIESLEQKGFVRYNKENESIIVNEDFDCSFSFWLRSEYEKKEAERAKTILKFKAAKRKITANDIYGWGNFYSMIEDQLRYNLMTLMLDLYYSNYSIEHRGALNSIFYEFIYELGNEGKELMFFPEEARYYMDRIIKAEPMILENLEMIVTNPEALKKRFLEKVGQIENPEKKSSYRGYPLEMSFEVRNLITCTTEHLLTIARERYKKKKRGEIKKAA